MTKLASTSFEFNMVTTEDNSSDISEEIDELAGDLEFDSNHNETPNNDKRVSFSSDKINNDEKKQQQQQEEEDDDDDDEIFEIEKIVDHRTYRGSIQYMIKWKGYPDKHNSWVSKEHVYAEQKESEYWNNKEIEAKEKIKSLVDKHNINASKSMKRPKSNRIKKIKDKQIKKKSFVELKTTKTKGKLVNNNNGSNKDKGGYKNGVNRNNDINNNGKISSASYYTTPLQSTENSEFGEANNNSDNEGRYENEEMLKYDYDDDEYENFTPAAISGSWEPFVKDVATIQQDPCTGTLIVFLNWKNGHRTSHTNKVTNVKCPQKMLEFYQQHVQFVATNHQ
ncbi:hypothetical protein RhiirC2_740910 [Rhizophagus irregularis]|uniref:Chromo domain-containing protein n=1 Tax=Rhizophagus irregularis TaxID=588596 RepID=A0A2N1NHP5_9GLOM|nr:hypothetical protein RhiirC2_740910 [Rhizophagus irregularis]